MPDLIIGKDYNDNSGNTYTVVAVKWLRDDEFNIVVTVNNQIVEGINVVSSNEAVTLANIMQRNYFHKVITPVTMQMIQELKQ